MTQNLDGDAAVSNPGDGGKSPEGLQGANGDQGLACPPKPLTGPFKNVSEITPRPLEWVWNGVIPRGKLTLIVGEPGVGKSLLALHVAAMVTQGRRVPIFGADEIGSEEDRVGSASDERVMDDPDDRTQPGTVLIFSADDGSSDTVRPRLEAANADVSRVFLMSSEFQSVRLAPYTRLPVTGKEFESTRYFDQLDVCLSSFHNHGVDVPLIIIDPVERFLNCDERGNDLVDKVKRLVRTAARSGAAIVALANSILPASGVGRTAYRNATIGNEELARAARSVLLMTRDRDHENQRLVLPIKLNLGEAQPGMLFTIQDHNVTPNPIPTSLTSEDYFTQARQNSQGPSSREEASELQRVMAWLEERLRHGPVESNLIRKEAIENVISASTLRRAFRQLDCRATKAEQARHWVWRLPEQELRMLSKFKLDLESRQDADKTALAGQVEDQ